MNYESGKIWKETVVAYFKILSKHFLGGAEETLKNFSHNSMPLGQNMNLEPLKYKAGVLATCLGFRSDEHKLA